MLQPIEIEKLRNGTWEIDCPRMTLCQDSEDEPDTYRGGGYIKRTDDGSLSFKLFDAERQLDVKNIFRPKGISGKLIE